MDTVLHRLEALPGSSRYAVTFRRPDGSEQTATVQVDGADDDQRADGAGSARVVVAEASLPAGWSRDTDAFRATVAAVQALDAARRQGPPVVALHDVDGGWDVSLGNVVLDASGAPRCTAHGEMVADDRRFTCPECGAAALLG